jgi:hypothetical protein
MLDARDGTMVGFSNLDQAARLTRLAMSAS